MCFLEPPHACRRQNHRQKLADGAVLLDGMAKVRTRIDDVTVAPAVFNACQDPGFIKMRYQSHRAALRDPDPVRDFSQSGVRGLGQANQHVRVVTEKCPMRRRHTLLPDGEIQQVRILGHTKQEIKFMN